MKTTDANKSFLPEEVHSLIVQPVSRAAVALQVAEIARASDRANGFRVPIVTADPSAAWTAEGAEIATSDATLAETESRFFKLAGLTIVSRELAEDSSPAATTLVGQGLARDIARKLDAAFFGTKGASTVQPAGLADLAGVNEVDAGTAWADADPFIAAVFAAESVGATLTAFVAHPDDALGLAQLRKAAGSNEPLLGTSATEATRRVIAGVPVYTTPAVTEGTVWGLPRDRAIIALREDVRLDVDHSAYFGSDRVGIRATLRAAFAFPHAAAVQKITLSA